MQASNNHFGLCRPISRHRHSKIVGSVGNNPWFKERRRHSSDQLERSREKSGGPLFANIKYFRDKVETIAKNNDKLPRPSLQQMLDDSKASLSSATWTELT